MLSILSPSEQVAAHLRTEIGRGTWRGMMPGAPSLAKELGVDAKTVLAALDLLENEGLLVSQGVGKRRKIANGRITGARPLRITILPADQADKRLDYLGDLQHGLVEAGHHANFADKTMLDLGMDLGRIRRLVAKEEADAWILMSASREVLQWFSAQPVPAFALFGRFSGVPIAAVLPEKIRLYEALVDHLVALGHRRICLIARKVRRLPEPGRTERAFLARLQGHGIPTSPFHLPEWDDDQDGFHTLIDSLFRLTPPTALIIQEAFLFHAVHHFLASHKMRVPEDVSLACTDDDSSFAWCEPEISRIRWDSAPVVRRAIQWAARVGRGQEDLRQTFTPAMWIEGGTIGPVRG